MPSRLRDAIDTEREGQGLCLFAAEADCLYLFTPQGMDEVVEKARSKWSGSQQVFLRLFYSRISPVDFDAQGRIVIPTEMKKSVGIDRDAMFIGAHRRIEIWNPERWAKYEQDNRSDYGQKLGLIVEDVFGL